MEHLLLDIQKYSIHNGDGIRTTVFLKVVRSNVNGVIILKVNLIRQRLCITKKNALLVCAAL